jgi:BA14K-like protein
MTRALASGLAALLLTTSLGAAPAFARSKPAGPPPPYEYWQSRRDPPPGHEFRAPPPPAARWDQRNQPPPSWGRSQWEIRQRWLKSHGHDRYDNDSAAGLIVGTILGFVLGAAVADSRDQQTYAQSRLNDPAWIAYCARKYVSFDPYSGTYFGADGLRHYCR